MATAMEWSHDFCLNCDKQIAEGAYCSQACRLADLEKAGFSEPSCPPNLASFTTSTGTSSGDYTGCGFYLPPAVNFSAYRSTAKTCSAPTSPRGYAPYQTSYFTKPAPTTSGPDSTRSPTKGLTPSSSRSSLSSIGSTTTAQVVSPQAANQLRGYMSSFDQVRDVKRRLTLA